MLYSYTGQLLAVDMTTGQIEKQPLREEFARQYIGGRGLGARYLYDLLKPGADPLSPDNVILAMTGPFTGTGIYACQKYEWTSKSPLTGIYLCSNSGGRLGDRLKRSGYDGIIIKGAADASKYLLIDGEKVELRDASFVWGKKVSETQNMIREVTGASAVVCTGSAADLPIPVKFAGVYDGPRCSGRGGLGAVFGSKKLKAIAVTPPPRRGETPFQLHDPERMRDLMSELLEDMRENPVTGDQLPKAGSIIWLDASAEFGIFPTRNYQAILTTEDVEGKLDAETFEKYVAKDQESGFANCISCPIKSGHVVIPDRGDWVGQPTKGPEFESAWALGPNLGIMDYDHIIAANKACNEYGIDTISTGGAIGFAMECHQRGLLDKLEGKLLEWDSSEAVINLIREIAKREGWLGNLLADGVRAASKEIGAGTSDFALHVKGLEVPAYDPRGVWGMGLTYATACRGACHLKSWTVGAEFRDYEPTSTVGKAALVKSIQDLRAVLDSLIVCIFAGRAITREWVVKLVNSATDFGWTEKDIDEFGARIYNLERLLAVRDGITSKDDTLPHRILEECLKGGRSDGTSIGKENFQRMLQEYYQLQGWDENGIPRERPDEHIRNGDIS